MQAHQQAHPQGGRVRVPAKDQHQSHACGTSHSCRHGMVHAHVQLLVAP
jgi:hypothetical protein